MKLLEAETKLKLICIIHLKKFTSSILLEFLPAVVKYIATCDRYDADLPQGCLHLMADSSLDKCNICGDSLDTYKHLDTGESRVACGTWQSG